MRRIDAHRQRRGGILPHVSAELTVLSAGYADDRVASTVVLIVEGDVRIIVDPGMVRSRDVILDPLRALQIEPADITDVVLSHHHPDHTLNAALFTAARVHDFQAIYQDDVWTDADGEGRVLSPSVVLMETPGHTAQDVSTAVRTEAGLVVCTHLWWSAEGPLEDPFCDEPAVLAASRERVLDLDPVLIVPGHGAPFAPDSSTPV